MARIMFSLLLFCLITGMVAVSFILGQTDLIPTLILVLLFILILHKLDKIEYALSDERRDIDRIFYEKRKFFILVFIVICVIEILAIKKYMPAIKDKYFEKEKVDMAQTTIINNYYDGLDDLLKEIDGMPAATEKNEEKEPDKQPAGEGKVKND